MINKILKAIYRTLFLLKSLSPYGRMSFGQEGEDIVLSKIFQFYRKGFYVDVGAHHPVKYSNTKLFYDRGWSGINIDPIPGMKKKFDHARPRDINIECGVGKEKGKINFFIFEEGAYNTCSPDKAAKVKKSGVKLLEEKSIPVLKLSDILKEHVPSGQEIDILTIDVETLDFEVLQSNDWKEFRPKIVLVEMLETNIEKCHEDPVFIFMKEQGYDLMSKTVNTSFFKRQDFDEKVKPKS